MTVPTTNTTVTPAVPVSPATGDVLHNEQHSRLTTADIAKAVARHKREHPNEHLNRKASSAAPKNRPVPQKTTPRG